MTKELFVLVVIVIIFVTGCASVQEDTFDVVEVNDFASCVAAGNPVMESYPEQCYDSGTDRTYVNEKQVLPVEPDGGIGDGAGPLPTLCEDPRPEMCTREYIPVCGSDGKTYGNSCTACSNTAVSGYREGECLAKDPVMCTMQYDPVCGSDGVTYGNACQAGVAGVDVISKGECETEVHICSEAEKAAEVCTMEYMPVCGSDKNTYGNGCSACSAGVDSYEKGEC